MSDSKGHRVQSLSLSLFFLKKQKAFKTIASEYRKTIKMKRQEAQGHIHLEHDMNWHMVCVFIAKPRLVRLLISVVFTTLLLLFIYLDVSPVRCLFFLLLYRPYRNADLKQLSQN